MDEKWIVVGSTRVSYSCREALGDILAVSGLMGGEGSGAAESGGADPDVLPREIVRAWLLSLSDYAAKIIRTLILCGGTATSRRVCAEASIQARGMARSVQKMNESWDRLRPGSVFVELRRPSQKKLVLTLNSQIEKMITKEHQSWLCS